MPDSPAVGYPLSSAEAAAGVTPTNYVYPPINPLRYGAAWNNSTDDTAATNSAISVAEQTISGAVGQVVNLPLGTSILSSQVTLPDDVRFLGTNKNGSIFKAAAGFSGSYVFDAVNGTSSMFDSILENLTVNANNVSGLGCILAQAWQENSGPRSCLLQNFTTYGLRYSNGYGGAAYNLVRDTEMFGSSTTAPTAGIQVDQISSAGTFVLNVERATINGNSSHFIAKGINIVNDSSVLKSVHFENCTTGIYIAGVGHHTIINCTGDGSLTNLVQIDSNFSGTVTMIGCLRGGSSTNFLNDGRTGGYGAVTGADPGTFIIGALSSSAISGITRASSAVVTLSSTVTGNPFGVGNAVAFSGVVGMTQINGLVGTVSAIGGSSGAWTITVNINSSAFSAYTSGGTAFVSSGRAVSADNTAKAWCVFDGTTTGTNAPTTGFNVTSVKRNSTGNYTVNFTNPLTNAVAPIAVTTALDSASVPAVANLGGGLGYSQFTVRLAGTLTDSTTITFICFGFGT